MVNGLGSLLSFVDTNVSSNNSPYNLNNYSYDDSFANMLNKTQTDYSAPSSVSNKIERHLNTEENYKENNYNSYDDYYNDYNEYDADDNLNAIEEKSSSSDENTLKKADAASDNHKSEDAKQVNDTKEEQAENKSEELNASSNKDNIEEKADKLASGNENVSSKEKLALTKEKAKLILQNTSNDKKADAKEVNTADAKENILAKADKKENTKKTEEIENIKRQIESLNAEELSEEDKKELEDLIESLEALKAMIENDGSEDKKEVLAEKNEDNIEVKDIDYSDDIKEIKIASNKDNDKNIETKDINDISIEDNAMLIDNNAAADANIDMNIENKYADKKDAAEIKNNNSSVNNTISDDKGAELTIINMKDSADGANLKGYNHYNNNVSKTHNSTNLTDNMIKFQDLMGKLVEKAQVAVNNGKSEVLMSLNPEYLGKVRLKISMDGDNLIGKIFVDNADVKDIFTKNLDTVITSLSEIGINIEGFDVMLRQDMPNDGGFSEELESIGNRFASENNNNVEEVKADIKAYIVPERKLNLLI
ncbi:flagellar hook-length control protein FliK [Brachyspira hampsonii]|uniref:Flagellar hook-length control protein n=1 Tax=Brachyspira hampsonii TaxID=1287055 RepID=A0AAC9TT53_9SPIR|nr:flagellar hook-length control protein FliK [Brachyspira hampsonii]ASJ21685.1 flagellar hook-length control protein [Brachyspira hampsonii]ELV06966.1 flagellar hook-length control domain-containing protein [Brachyspira hampsonii 30599]MBW5379127.1 flagellar hook-length control protein [Brachyspira hampsonii]MBW5408925.1 flagellar hook-length control protein [Brachyspira hampsonii]OEJ18860.1 flagellar hook-length control protein [Brachyspira hampsonii]